MTRPGTGSYTPPYPPAPSAGSTAIWDASIGTVAELALVPTINLGTPSIRAWINEDTAVTEVWHLMPSTAETIEGVIQRPTDFTFANPKVWFKASS